MGRVLVTGASGFLGRATVSALRAVGTEAVPVTRRAVDDPAAMRVDSYAALALRSDDVLIHLAESATIGAVDGAGATAEQEAVATVDALVSKRPAHIVYASSCAVYGGDGEAPHQPEGPTPNSGLYARIKRTNEAAVLAAGGTVLRLANLIGPGMHCQTVLGDLMAQLSSPGPVALRNLSPMRDFLAVEDAARAFVQAAVERVPGIFNVASGHSVSVAELARRVLIVAGQPQRDIVETHPGTGRSVLRLDISKSVDVLNWRPRIGLDDALAQLVREWDSV